MTPPRESALVEPVVDVVDAKSVCTDAVPILSIDLKTCTVDDLSFSSAFKLTATRNDYIHALVAYFECGFTQIHRPMGFSTSPFARYTHWKQTIFYVRDAPLTISRGEEVNGTISCRPNSRNRRDLDIDIGLKFEGRHCQAEGMSEYRLR
uniref:Protein arginine N-methyltransferase domain-containing protein n=1 Tax=Odontella aurita TaxID=265563 RepID=A0A7S4IXC9_9STRA